MTEYRYAYVHGFGSSSKSNKGVQMAAHFARQGLTLHLPDLNWPSFGELTAHGALSVIDRMDSEVEGGPWRLIGSSMGGYLTALWTQAHPEKVDKIVLLCPGFNILERWPTIVGASRMEKWRTTGVLSVPDPSGEMSDLWWEFVTSWDKYAQFPEVACETLVFHGRQDVTVPVESSRAWVANQKNARLVEFDDDHRLMGSLEKILLGVDEYFSIDSE